MLSKQRHNFNTYISFPYFIHKFFCLYTGNKNDDDLFKRKNRAPQKFKSRKLGQNKMNISLYQLALSRKVESLSMSNGYVILTVTDNDGLIHTYKIEEVGDYEKNNISNYNPKPPNNGQPQTNTTGGSR
jgi:hypothetical protein